MQLLLISTIDFLLHGAIALNLNPTKITDIKLLQQYFSF